MNSINIFSIRPSPGLVLTLLLAILPKCPLCIAAYLAAFGVVGTHSFLTPVWGLPLMLLALAATLVMLGLRSRSRRRPGPLLLGVMAAALIVLGKFTIGSSPLLALGAVLLVSATAWNAWPYPAPATQPHSA